MKTLLSAFALTAALTSAALASEPMTSADTARPGPVALNEVQMDSVAAGGRVDGFLKIPDMPGTALVTHPRQAATGVEQLTLVGVGSSGIER